MTEVMDGLREEMESGTMTRALSRSYQATADLPAVCQREDGVLLDLG